MGWHCLRPSDFEYTQEMDVFDLFQVNLYHGWVIDPENSQLSEVALFCCAFLLSFLPSLYFSRQIESERKSTWICGSIRNIPLSLSRPCAQVVGSKGYNQLVEMAVEASSVLSARESVDFCALVFAATSVISVVPSCCGCAFFGFVIVVVGFRVVVVVIPCCWGWCWS